MTPDTPIDATAAPPETAAPPARPKTDAMNEAAAPPAPHTPPALEVRGVTVRYPNSAGPALRDVTFQLADREVVALTGPSGCGKSTLLRAIAGLEQLENGEVLWQGADLSRVPPHKRGFGLMFQDGQLFAHLNVAKNVAYGLAAQRIPKLKRQQRVSELLDLVGLPGSGHRSVTELSGGERQRVALARSLAPQPRLLLLDEPLSSLDRTLRDHLASELATLLRDTGTTAILVTHDPDEARSIADRVLNMHQGRINS